MGKGIGQLVPSIPHSCRKSKHNRKTPKSDGGGWSVQVAIALGNLCQQPVTPKQPTSVPS